MYESFFGLDEKPFSLLPDPSFFYLSKIHQEALTLVEYGLYNQSGFTVLTGEVGSGKTTLMRYLLGQLDDELTVGLISNTHQSLGQIMDWVCAAFELDAPSGKKLDQHQAFVDFLLKQYSKGKKTLLIIDEAQNLGLERLEEIRLLSNINADKDLVLQLLLLGQPQLRQQLRKPELEQFIQRVSASYHLGRLSSEETFHYIRHRLRVVGGSKEIFTPDACHAAFHYSKGIPRIINLICETALVLSYGMGEKIVTGKAIDDFVQSEASHLLFAVDSDERVPLTEEAVQRFMESVGYTQEEQAPLLEEPAPEVSVERKETETEPTSAESQPHDRSHFAATDAPQEPASGDAHSPTRSSAEPPSPAPEPAPTHEALHPTKRQSAKALGLVVQSVANREAEDAIPPIRLTEEDLPQADFAAAQQSLESGQVPKRQRTKEILAITLGLGMGFVLALSYVLWGHKERPQEPAVAESQAAPTDRTETKQTSAALETPQTPPAPAAVDANQPSTVASTTDATEDPTPVATDETAVTAQTPKTPKATTPALAQPEKQDSTASTEEPDTSTAQARPVEETADASVSTQGDKSNGLTQVAQEIASMGLSPKRIAPDRIRTNLADRVQFGPGSAELDQQALTLLIRLADIAKQDDRLDVVVTAHTDSKGSRALNQSLSDRRATKVADMLIAAGIAPERVKAVGKGEDELLVAPKVEQERGPLVNRRIEIDLIETQPPELKNAPSLLPDQLLRKNIGQI